MRWVLLAVAIVSRVDRADSGVLVGDVGLGTQLLHSQFSSPPPADQWRYFPLDLQVELGMPVARRVDVVAAAVGTLPLSGAISLAEAGARYRIDDGLYAGLALGVASATLDAGRDGEPISQYGISGELAIRYVIPGQSESGWAFTARLLTASHLSTSHDFSYLSPMTTFQAFALAVGYHWGH